GVDSSYLQAVWNKVVTGRDLAPPSYSVAVDHPRSWQDTEYAVTAARLLGTRHVRVPADLPYPSYLVETLAATGEPLNHVQSAYFLHLARRMRAAGNGCGLCGEGADSLFGVGLAHELHKARRLERLVPGTALREGLASLTDGLGAGRLAQALRLSNRQTAWADREHPVNQVAVFADYSSVEDCFGETSIDEALAERRRLVDL